MLALNLEELVNNYLIIDCHIHLGSLSDLFIPSDSNDTLISALKRFGVKKAITATHRELSTINYGFNELIELLNKYKDFLFGYLVFNPNFEDDSLKIIQKYFNHKSIVGIKIHPSWHLTYPFDKKYEKFWNFASENEIPVITHSWNPDVPNKSQRYSDPFFFEDIIKEHPKLKLILAHAGGRGKVLYDVINLLEKYENLYVDFAGDIFVPGLIEEYVKRVGSAKIIFGTDMPWVDVRFQLFNILNSDISDEDKRNILGLNAVKFFNLEV